jgi:hypothetical protein
MRDQHWEDWMIARALVVALVLAFPVHAQNKPGQPEVAPPGVDPNAHRLQERKDVLSWKLLAQVELVKQKDRFVPQFSSSVAALDQTEVKLQGFIVPLAMGAGQTHFILSAIPISCPFCVPAGAESLVEVKTKNPVRFTFEPVVIRGNLSVLKDDPIGVYYRLTDGVESN